MVSSSINDHNAERVGSSGRKDSFPERIKVVNRMTSGVRTHLATLMTLYFVGGVLEAAFLVSIARIGLAIAENDATLLIAKDLELTIGNALLFTTSLLILRLALSLISVRATLGLTYRIVVGLRKALSHAFLRASWKIQQTQPSGTLQQVTISFPGQAAELTTQLANALGAGLTLFAMLSISIAVDPVSTVVVIVILLLLSLILRPLRKKLSSNSQDSVAPQVAFSNGVAEMGSLGLEIQSFGIQEQAEQFLDALISDDADANRRVGLIGYSISPVYVTLAYGAVLAALMVIASLGTEEIRSSGAVMLIMLRALSYGQQLQQGSAALAQALPLLQQIEETTEFFVLNRATGGDRKITSIGKIHFQKVDFSYNPDRFALQDFSGVLEKGLCYGVIGPSGSGKTTFVQLLLGIRNPDRGIITVDGIDLQDIERKSWSSKVAFVPQDAILITGTIEENIQFFRTEISELDLIEATGAANFLADIQKLPEGFKTHLGERGQQLSGGQRQRLSIARALVGKPDLLILDEPTSALDMKSENAIRQTLAELRGKVTVVVIAHRLSTLDICDQLIVIQDGRLKAIGTPNDLAANNDFYIESLRAAGLK